MSTPPVTDARVARHILTVAVDPRDPEWMQYGVDCPNDLQDPDRECSEWMECCGNPDFDDDPDDNLADDLYDGLPCPRYPGRMHRYIGSLGGCGVDTHRRWIAANESLADAASDLGLTPGRYYVSAGNDVWDEFLTLTNPELIPETAA